MQFFREKNGKYIAGSVSGNPSVRSALRAGMVLVSAGIFAYVLFMSPIRDQIEDKTPLFIAFGVVLFTNTFFFMMRRAGMGADLIVDQMNGTLSYRKPGGHRQSVPISELKGLILTVVPMKASILSMENTDGTRRILMYSTDTDKMRMYAGELSTLTSLSVSEESRS